jgi:hypothetical protein
LFDGFASSDVPLKKEQAVLLPTRDPQTLLITKKISRNSSYASGSFSNAGIGIWIYDSKSTERG